MKSLDDRAQRAGAIDELRGLAILLVVVYHAGPLAWRLVDYAPDGWMRWPAHVSLLDVLAAPFLHFGFVGVHCFFVLSGFCIHLRAARTGEQPALRGYFLRRFWRIYPPYWIALALFVVWPYALARLGVTSTQGTATATDVALHTTMLHTLAPATFFSINPAFWSLATEEQFYLAYPLIARLLLGRVGARRVVLAALALSLVWRGVALALVPTTVDHFMDWRVLVHGLFVPRWFDWLLGCWIADAWARNPGLLQRNKARLALAALGLLLAGAACRVHIAVDKLLSDILFSSAFAALTAAALGNLFNGIPVAVRSLFSAVGRRAYAIYLVHQPILDLPKLGVALRLALAGVASFVFGRAVEKPFEERARRVR